MDFICYLFANLSSCYCAWKSVGSARLAKYNRFLVLFCYRFKMTIRPAYRPKIVKKRTKRFIRHQSDRYGKLAVSIWNLFILEFVRRSSSALCFSTTCYILLTLLFSFSSRTGVSPRVSITECVAVSRANIWCRTLVTVQTNVPVICYRMDLKNSWYTTLKSWRFCWCKIVYIAVKLPTMFHRKNARKLLNAPNSCRFGWQIRMGDFVHRKMSKSLP